MRQQYLLFVCLPLLLLLIAQPVLADRTIVRMQTNYGDLYINLYDDEAPITVENFLSYVNKGFYDGLIIHRIENDFVIQGGAYDPNLYDADFTSTDPNFAIDPNFYHEPNDPIILELDADLENLRGTVAMARTTVLDSATSQFFINIEDNSTLDPGGSLGGYAVFGEVIEGMDVVDTLNLVEVEDKHDSFGALPVDPVIIESASVFRQFDPNSADFSDVPFLGGSDGLIRTYVGQGQYTQSEFRHEFTEEELLGVSCLKWHQTASSEDEISSFSMVIARDADGQMWILKYVLNEDQDDEQVVIEADTLLDAVSFDTFADENMPFRLITGRYNPDDLDDPDNTLSEGFGAAKETEQIISVSESLLPDWTDNNLVLVKWTKGPADSPSDIKWRYYDPNEGLVLDLWDDEQIIDSDGWIQTALVFDNTSDDFSDVSFIKAAAGVTRTFVGQGSYALSTYTHTFTAGDESFRGINYIVWQQSELDWDADATPVENDLTPFTLRLAKDVNGDIWVFEYIRDGETIFEAEYLYEARLLSEFDEDDMLFRLITQGHNPDNLNDPVNTITIGSGSESQTEKINSFTETLSHVPHYQNELVRVKKWQGTTSDNNNISYYHESIGLVLNLRNGQSGADGDGWHLAFYGGTFSSTVNSLADVDFLNATAGLTRNFIGQGSLAVDDDTAFFTHVFSSITYQTIYGLRWRLYPRTDTDTDYFYIDIAKDSLDTLWVLRYYVNGSKVYSSASSYEALLLSDFADNNMHFRLIAGLCDLDNLEAAANTITYTDDDDDTITEQIVSLNAAIDFLPYYEDSLILVKQTRASDASDVRWRYYQRKAGFVLELRTASQTIPSPADDTEGFRLGWYGQNKPTFDYDSNDFSDVPYFHAAPGQFMFYRGQGQFDGAFYRRFFSTEQFLDTNCLDITETAVEQYGKTAIKMLVARDTNDALWLLQAVNDGQTLLDAQAIDQIAPFDWLPDIHFQLAAGNDEVGTEVSSGSGELLETQTIVRAEQSLDDYDEFSDFDDELLLVRTESGQDPVDVDWSWYHESTGLALDLWDNFTDPDLTEPNLYEPNDLSPAEGDGWFLAEPNDLENLFITLKAGKTRDAHNDAFALKGDLALTADSFNSGDFFLAVGPYSLSLNLADFNRSANTATWRGSPDGNGYVIIHFNLKKEIFTIAARKIDLTGLQAPIQVSLQIGDFYTQGTAVLKGQKNVPILFLQGNADKIQLKNFTFVDITSQLDPAYPYDTLTINGEIAVSDSQIDLSSHSATLKWGSTSMSIDEGDIKRVGNRQVFIYKHPTADIRLARFDLAKGAFTVKIRKSSLSAPSQTFTLTFIDEAEDIVFSQQMTVSGP